MRRQIGLLVRKLGYYSKPDFMIIGVQKGGTTALFDILNQHSHLQGSYDKEIHYFNNNEWYEKNKLEEYHYSFLLPHKVKSQTLLFEGTPTYIYHPEGAERLHRYNPNLKLIIILREPISRAFSAWKMYHYYFKSRGSFDLYDERTFEEAIEEEIQQISSMDFVLHAPRYMDRGIYYKQILKYFQFYSRDQILILESEELKTKHPEVMCQIQNFLAVPIELLAPLNSNLSFRPDIKIKEAVKERLKVFYAPYNRKLFALIEKKYEWNSN
ncbi:MAG: sulfotransferase domain-containing protein [Bacteroidota bacterium]